MSPRKPPSSDRRDHDASLEEAAPLEPELTESIDLRGLFTSHLTASGSFDVRGGIWATTFGRVMQALPIPALLVEETLTVLVANQACGKISPHYEESQGKPFCELFPGGRYAERAQGLIEECFRTRRPLVAEIPLQILDRRIWGRLTFRSMRILQDRLVLVLIEDLTLQKQQRALDVKRRQELEIRVEERTGELSASNERLQQEILRRQRIEEKLRESGHELEERVRNRTADLVAANEALQASLREKELLLKEIHHRVKNNLQIMSSLIQLQSRFVTDQHHAWMFRDTESRIQSMALVYEELYRSGDLGQIYMVEYVTRLLEDLRASYEVPGAIAHMRVDVDELVFGVDTAVPFGLIMVELVSNALRHARPKVSETMVDVALTSRGDRTFRLVVSDNGIGLPVGFDPEKPTSLGVELVQLLAAQLHADVKWTSSPDAGTEFVMVFKELPPRKPRGRRDGSIADSHR